MDILPLPFRIYSTTINNSETVKSNRSSNIDYQLSVMSFNIRYDEPADGEHRWDNRKSACLMMIDDLKPMVMGLQEVLVDQLHYLLQHLVDYRYVGVGRDDGESLGEFNPILFDSNRVELLKSDTFWLSETPDTPSRGWDGACNRIVTWAHFRDRCEDREFYLFNTHFDHEGEVARGESAKLLISKIDELSCGEVPIIITGDFNGIISDHIFQPILKRYFSSRKVAEYTDNIDSFNCWGRWHYNSNIDFIFFNNAKSLTFKTIDKDYGVPYISDHYPIFSTYKYR